MIPCTVTTGFFVLAHCGRAAVASCPQCSRPVCDRHGAQQGGLCPECVSAQEYGGEAEPYDPSWTSGYRRRYYERSSQAYSDPAWYSSFNEYDRGAFNPGDGYSYGEGDFDPGHDTGFVDS
ncbi:hypothetical protein [Actinomadura terrae]|uniref:hypothetical protein n=1 Tax=Actinomadura terrae TaxID=604353 RepID=UPI001FA6B8E3|nr:hypothetical protein [Actinomadura terrae]